MMKKFTNIALHLRPLTILCFLFFGPLLPYTPTWLLKNKIKQVKRKKKTKNAFYLIYRKCWSTGKKAGLYSAKGQKERLA
jgi:hypothetical protein